MPWPVETLQQPPRGSRPFYPLSDFRVFNPLASNAHLVFPSYLQARRSRGARAAVSWRSRGDLVAVAWRSHGGRMAVAWRSHGDHILAWLPRDRPARTPQLSSNYYQPGWWNTSHRRLKNVAMLLEWVPSPAALNEVQHEDSTALTDSQDRRRAAHGRPMRMCSHVAVT